MRTLERARIILPRGTPKGVRALFVPVEDAGPKAGPEAGPLVLTRRNLWPLIAGHATLDLLLMLQVYLGMTGT